MWGRPTDSMAPAALSPRPAMTGSPTGPIPAATTDPQPHWRPLMTHEEHDRDTVVVTDDRSSGLGAIIGIIAIVVLLLAVWWFALGPGASPSTTTTNNNNTINPPAVPTEQAPAPASS